MKVKTTIYVYYSKYAWEEKGEYLAFYAKIDDDKNQTYVCEQEVELEIPDNYDPRAQKVAALQKQKEKAMADYQKTLTEINEQISKLQAIEYTP